MTNFRAFRVEKTDTGFVRSVVERDEASLPAGDVLIEVRYSSVNFKDGLSATGNPGVTRNFPHTPGIDAAGIDADLLSGTNLRTVMVVNIGKPGENAWFDRLPRLSYESVTTVL